MPKLVQSGHDPEDFPVMFDLKADDLRLSFLEYGCTSTAFHNAIQHSGGRCMSYDAVFPLKIPVKDFTFDFALSAHYLFSGLESQDLAFHMQVLQELARVAKEVRIFPLIDRLGHPSELLGPLLKGLQEKNYGVEVRTVTYSVPEEGNALLRVFAQECALSM